MIIRKIIKESDDLNEARNFILKNCQPFLSEAGISDVFQNKLLRGFQSVGRTATPFSFIKSPRENRNPQGSSLSTMEFADEAMRAQGLKAVRSNSLFCTSNWDTANNFGSTYMVYPIGNFNYSWSPKIDDWWSTKRFITTTINMTEERELMPLSRYLRTNNLPESARKVAASYADPPTTRDEWRLLIDVFKKSVIQEIIQKSDYKGDDGSLKEALNSSNEIMIHCSQVFCVTTKQQLLTPPDDWNNL